MKDRYRWSRGARVALVLSAALAACDRSTPEDGAGPGEEPADAASDGDGAGLDADGSFPDDAGLGGEHDASFAPDAADPDATNSDASDAMDGSASDGGDVHDGASDVDASTCTPTDPLPTITSVAPTLIPVEVGTEIWLDIGGSGFDPCVSAYKRSISLTPIGIPTVYVSPTQLRAQVPYLNTSDVGGRMIHVGIMRDSAHLTATTDLPLMPVAQITSLTPSSVPAGSSGFTLDVSGPCGGIHGAFDTNAKIYINSTELPGVAVRGTLGFGNWCGATATVPAALVAHAGTVDVTVVNPGVHASAPASFLITP